MWAGASPCVAVCGHSIACKWLGTDVITSFPPKISSLLTRWRFKRVSPWYFGSRYTEDVLTSVYLHKMKKRPLGTKTVIWQATVGTALVRFRTNGRQCVNCTFDKFCRSARTGTADVRVDVRANRQISSNTQQNTTRPTPRPCRHPSRYFALLIIVSWVWGTSHNSNSFVLKAVAPGSGALSRCSEWLLLCDWPISAEYSREPCSKIS